MPHDFYLSKCPTDPSDQFGAWQSVWFQALGKSPPNAL